MPHISIAVFFYLHKSLKLIIVKKNPLVSLWSLMHFKGIKKQMDSFLEVLSFKAVANYTIF